MKRRGFLGALAASPFLGQFAGGEAIEFDDGLVGLLSRSGPQPMGDFESLVASAIRKSGAAFAANIKGSNALLARLSRTD